MDHEPQVTDVQIRTPSSQHRYSLRWKLESLLFGVDPTEPESFAGVALLTLGVALLGSYIPARRITQINPVTALHRIGQ